jgi:ubiquinone/menaquinone biosynthesis C-methylase UbiE
MQAAYDSIADWYDAWVRDETSVDNASVSTFLDFIGAVDNQLICDVACGQGRVARLLAQRNARVLGVDISSQLIAIAQQEEQQVPLGIQYFLDDAQTLAQLDDCTFDGATSYLALMDIPDLEALCHAVYRILRPRGWFGFAITHPCFESPHSQWRTDTTGKVSLEVTEYFTEGFWQSENSNRIRGMLGANHRKISTYINTLIATGFEIKHLYEPEATQAAIERVPGCRIVPTILFISCVKKYTK